MSIPSPLPPLILTHFIYPVFSLLSLCLYLTLSLAYIHYIFLPTFSPAVLLTTTEVLESASSLPMRVSPSVLM